MKTRTLRVISLCLSIVTVCSLWLSTYVFATNAATLAQVAQSQPQNTSGAKYQEWFYGKKNNVAWCAIFVAWCANQAGVPTNVIPQNANCGGMYNGVVQGGGSRVTTPQAGDLVFYYDKNANRYAHVGIMVNSTESVQGNVASVVYHLKKVTDYNLGYKSKAKKKNYDVVYLRPNYGSSGNPGTTITIKPVSVKVTTTTADSITETSAIVRGSFSVSGGKATECGMYIGTSTSNMKKLGSDSVNTSGTTFYYSTSKYGMLLARGTTYYYQAYAVVNGETIKANNIESFTTIGGCTEHVKGQYLWPEDSHPHYQYYTCANCGETFTDGTTATMDWCEECNGPHRHTKGAYLYPGDAHPHYQYYTCSTCGETFADGTAPLDSCEECNPSKVKLSVKGSSGIKQTTARVDASCSYTGTRPTTVGLYLGTSTSSMGTWDSDNINHNKNPFDIWYNLSSLSAGTTYYYQFYAVVNGKTITSDVNSFTTQPAENTRTGTVTGTSGQYLAINDKPAASPAHSTQIGRIPPGGTVTVYTDKTSGNWYWVEYGGVYGWVYGKYISLS